METQIVSIVGQWGIAGLFFYMWWKERTDRLKSDEEKNECSTALKNTIEVNSVLIDLVKENISTNIALREAINHLIADRSSEGFNQQASSG